MDIAARISKLPISSSNPIWNQVNKLADILRDTNYHTAEIFDAIEKVERAAEDHKKCEDALINERKYNLTSYKEYRRRLKDYLKEIEREIKNTKNCLKLIDKYHKKERLAMNEELVELHLIHAQVFNVICDLEYKIKIQSVQLKHLC